MDSGTIEEYVRNLEEAIDDKDKEIEDLELRVAELCEEGDYEKDRAESLEEELKELKSSS